MVESVVADAKGKLAAWNIAFREMLARKAKGNAPSSSNGIAPGGL